MADTIDARILARCRSLEDYRRLAYRCPAGKLTIGYGRNLEDNGVTEAEADYLLVNDVVRVTRALKKMLPVWSGLSPARQAALVDMGFQLGVDGLMGFQRMLACLQAGDFDGAAREVMDSHYGREFVRRARQNASMIRTGEWS